jgi:thioredoxin reductase
MDKDFECVVVGGGAAGLSAALVLGRARRATLVVDAGRQSNRPDHGIGGLLGNNGTAPSRFYSEAADEVDRHATVERIDGSVVSAERDEGGFSLTTADRAGISAANVILATGMDYQYPDLPGVAELWGTDVFHCPFCHGWEAREGRIAVIVESPADAMRARLIQLWSDRVTVLTNGGRLDGEQASTIEAAGLPVVSAPVERLLTENGSLRAVGFDDGNEVEFDSVLVPITMRHRSDLAGQLGAEVVEQPNAFIVDPLKVDFLQQTSVPGLFAAGDVATQGAPSVAAAICEGHRAGAGVVHEIALSQ